MANELAHRGPTTAQTVDGWLAGSGLKERVGQALAGYMSAETFLGQCSMALRDPALAKSTSETLLGAFLQCAQMGLLPSPHHHHVALIPKGGGILVMPQWQGYKALMERAPGVKRIHAELVHETDDFEITEEGRIIHRFDPFSANRQFVMPTGQHSGGLRGGYFVADMTDGTQIQHFVSAAKIHRNRACAETQKLWQQWFPEMALKTVYRDAWARRVIPLPIELADRLGEADDADDRALDNDPSRVVVPMRPTTTTDRLKARLGVSAPTEATPAADHAPTEAAPAESGTPTPTREREPGDDDGEVA